MKLLNAVFATLALSLSVSAWAAAPSEDSVSKLLEVMQVRGQTDSILKQVDDMIRNSAEQALNGRKLNTREQEIFDDSRAKVVTLIKQEISWASMEPVYRKIYRESFDQEEVDGMIAFYQTPVGKSVVRKLPVVTQSSMAVMQQKMQALTPRLQKIQQETAAKLKDQSGK